MTFADAFASRPAFLMEGGLGERLKREHGLSPHPEVTWAGLVYGDTSRRALSSLWREYMAIAHRHQAPFLATTPTRHANRRRVEVSGFPESILADNLRFLREIRDAAKQEMYVGGLVGCDGNAYTGSDALTEAEAEVFHRWSIERFARAGADFVYAGIMPALPEAAGLARACAGIGLPCLISFTVRADGRLPDGTGIHDAIARIDGATGGFPLCYMTNCIHPSILFEALSRDFNRTDLVRSRFMGLQANASCLSSEALDGSAALHTTQPAELAEAMLSLKQLMPLKIIGGCCGTDGTHMEAMAAFFWGAVKEPPPQGNKLP